MLELLGVLGIPVVGGGNRDPGDVIAALSEKAGSEGWLTRIATQDTRYHALLDGDSVRALDSRTMDLVSDTDVLLEHGVRPKHIPDLFALAGDHYNNLKGTTPAAVVYGDAICLIHRMHGRCVYVWRVSSCRSTAEIRRCG